MTVRSTPGVGTCFSIRLYLPELAAGRHVQVLLRLVLRGQQQDHAVNRLVVQRREVDTGDAATHGAHHLRPDRGY